MGLRKIPAADAMTSLLGPHRINKEAGKFVDTRSTA
jgi:hypothetical protein